MTRIPREVQRIDAERRSIERAAVVASRLVMRAIQRATIGAFSEGDDPVVEVRPRLQVLIPLMSDALLVAYMRGWQRSVMQARRAIKQGVARPVGVGLSVFSEVINALQERTQHTDAQIAALQDEFVATAALNIQDSAGLMERFVQQTLLDATRSGLNKREGLKAFTEAMRTSGLTRQSSHVVNTIFRTQTAVAYSVGQQRANDTPEIREILWGYEYKSVGDDRVRPAHAAMDGVRAEKDDPIWGEWSPPSGWNCRCVRISIFEGQSLANPKEPPAETTDHLGRTVPVVPDQGFAVNPADIFPTLSQTPVVLPTAPRPKLRKPTPTAQAPTPTAKPTTPAPKPKPTVTRKATAKRPAPAKPAPPKKIAKAKPTSADLKKELAETKARREAAARKLEQGKAAVAKQKAELAKLEQAKAAPKPAGTLKPKEWKASLSREERLAFDNWSGLGSENIRAAQLAGKPNLTVRELERSLNRAQPFDGSKQSLWRGMHNVGPKDMQQLLSADSISVDAISSASKKKIIGEGFALPRGGIAPGQSVLFEIRGSTTAVDITQIVGQKEGEVLLRKGARYRRIGTESVEIGIKKEPAIKIILEQI